MLDLQRQVARVHAAQPLIEYLLDLLAATRHQGRFAEGLSPRAGLALLAGARAWALLAGRDRVLPEDVQAVATPIIGHRLRPLDDTGERRELLIQRLIEAVPIP